MSSEETESYLSSIEEYIFDEKKIVTYSWLSRTLGLHVNVSKQLLYTFYKNNAKKGELCATYLLIGVSNNGDTNQVLVVKDKDLEEVESSLKSVTSKHIYSVQKCVEISDLNVLYTAQKEENIDNISKGLSAIDFNCNERDSTLIAKLRFNALPVVSNQSSAFGKKTQPPPPPNKNKSPTKDIKDAQTVKNASSGESKQSEVKSESEKVVVPSMFKNNPAPKKKTGEKAAAAVNNKNSKGIGAFFSKTSKPVNEQKTVVDEEKNNKEKEVDTKEKRLSPLKENKATLNICEQNQRNSKTDSSPKEAPAKTKKADPKPSKETKKSDSKRSVSKKKATKKAVKDEKKRKRLVVLSDSDSNNDSEVDEEVQREPTPEPEPTMIPDDDDDDIIHGTPEPSRKRKKKLISKTFMTPDGYMVTEKQMVEASGSEDEEGAPEKKLKQSTTDNESLATKNGSTIGSKSAKSDSTEKKVSPKNTNPSPQKTKQSSLMNFFKKK